MARVFVSHASEDRGLAGELCRWLADDGHVVFLDQDLRDGIVLGEEWQGLFYDRLRWADAMVCVVTSAYLASTWCAAEVGIAQARGSRLLAFLAEPGIAHPLLTASQHADLTRDPVSARAELVELLHRVDAGGGLGWPDDRSPFPGLRPFDIDQHRVFFGRRGEVGQLAALLRSPAEHAEGELLLVVGPSGCGKSSLVRAGLLPAMAAEPGWWPLPPIVPGADPVAALARELAGAAQRIGLGWTAAQVRDQLAERGLRALADELLLAAPGGPWQRLLILVDQFEELLTRATPGRRAQFAQLLCPALSGPVRVVATLRSEFQDQLSADPGLRVLPIRTHLLRPLARETLSEVIEGPARLAGIAVTDELVARLVADTASGDALPLLAFTLDQLADGVSRGGQLSSERYDQLGGVRGALTRQAEAALAEATAATGRSREEVLAGLLRLVTVDEQGRPTRWRVSRDELTEPVIRELDVFVARRLVTTDTDTDTGSAVVEVAHEAFLSEWPPLAQAIEKNQSVLQARRTVEQAATEWDHHRRDPARLWGGGQLATVVADTGARIQSGDLVTDRVEFSPTARAFLRASIRKDRVRRGRAITVLSVLLLLALMATTVAVVAQRAAREQRNVAISRQIAAQAVELRATNPGLAAQLGLAAYRLAPTAEARGSLLSSVATPYSTILTGHTSGVFSVAFSADGRTLATGSDDMTARLWDVSDPRRLRPLGVLTGHTGRVFSVAFSPDGRTLATGSGDQTARLWDVSDPHHPSALSTLTGHTDTVSAVAFGPHGRVLATASLDLTARLWDVSDPRQPRPLGILAGHTDTVSAVAFSADGRALATASYDNTARLWDVSDPAQPNLLKVLAGHTNGVNAVAFSPSGHTLATASYDHTARLWDLSGPIISGHTGSFFLGVAFSPDGRTLATASYDNTARLWDVRDPRNPQLLGTLTGHTAIVNAVAFSPDGRTLATASYDRTARLWDVRDPSNPHALGILEGHRNYVFSVAFSPDGRTLATASYDNTARLWDVRDPRQPRPLGIVEGHTDTVFSVAFSPDGETLATASYDRTARLWDVSDPSRPLPLGILKGHTEAVYAVAFSPGGHILATAGADTTARLWDVSDPRQPRSLGELTGHTSGVRSVAFSPDGRTLATGSYDKTARLWEVSDPRRPFPMGILTGHTKAIYSVAFDPNGHTLATASYDDTVRLWETNVDNVTAQICGVTPAITISEWNQYLPGLPYSPPCP